MRGRGKGLIAAGLVVAACAALAGSAQGAVTIGSSLANPANESGPCGLLPCTVTGFSLVASAQAPGGLASPVNGTVTSWSFRAGSPAGQNVALRVLRPAGGMTYTGAGTSQPMTAAVGVNGPFATSLPIRSGDQAGLNAAPGAIIMNDIGAPSTALSWTIPMPLADGETREGAIVFNREVLVQATIEPTNTVAVGALTRNKKKGTAAVTVTVPNPGQLSYAGSGVSVTGPASVAAPGDVQLTVRATGKKAKKLKKKGKAGVSFGVTFTPDLGTAGITPETLTLRKKPKKKK